MRMRALWKDVVLAESDDTVVVEGNQMFYAYPTFHRGIQDALRDLDEHAGPESR